MHASDWKKKTLEVLKGIKAILSTSHEINSSGVLDVEN